MTLGPSEARPLPFRRRPDLRFSRLPFRRRTGWCVQDPLAARYYQLAEESYFLLQQLDSRISLAELRDRFETRFAPRRVELRQLQGLLRLFHEEGLVLSDLPDQGRRLAERRRRGARQASWLRWTNPLAIRFRGLDPRALLQFLDPLADRLFSPGSMRIGGLWILAIVFTFLLATDTIITRLPSLHDYLTPTNAFGLALTLAGVKIIHELAHGLSCRYHGGECREMGLMLLVFTPCLYCDTTDAWMIPERWKRIAISSAGMYVELLLATFASLLWYHSEPGFWNTVYLNVIIVCSVGTVLFNGNPFLRYDGYFMLADWLELPNLAEQASQMLWRRGLRITTGMRMDEPPGEENLPSWLPIYAGVALLYRVALTISILGFLWFAAGPHGLEPLVLLLALLSLLGMVWNPLQRALRSRPGARPDRGIHPPRLLSSLLVLAGVVGFIGFYPVPTYLRVPALLEPQGATSMYVATAGQLLYAVAEGTPVEPGTVLAELHDPDLAQQIAQLRTQIDVQTVHLANLERARIQDRESQIAGIGGQIPAAQQALADLRERLRQRLIEQKRMRITADRAGMVLPVRNRTSAVRDSELPDWVGSPLQPENWGCFLEEGTELCQIGTPESLHATVWVPESDYASLRLNQRVFVRFDAWPATRHAGWITEVAEVASEQLPPELSRIVPRVHDLQGASTGERDSGAYRVRVTLERAPRPAVIRVGGRATIETDSKTLAAQCYVLFCRTFRLARP